MTARRLTLFVLLALSWTSALSEAAEDGSWQQLAPPQRSSPVAIYDPTGDRLLLMGGTLSTGNFGDVWSLSLGTQPNWTSLPTVGIPPLLLAQPAFYDPDRSRIVLASNGVISFLSLPGLQWSSHAVTAPADGAEEWSLIFDPTRDRLLRFAGGIFEPHGHVTPVGDLFSLDVDAGSAWVLETPAGTAPAPRYGHVAIYDPMRDRMVVYGGTSATGALQDSWALSLGAPMSWSPLNPAGVPAVAPAGIPAMYDSQVDAMIVFGSAASIGILSLAGSGEWSSLAPPTPRPTDANFEVVCDPVRNQLLVPGGDVFGGATWVLSLGAAPVWSKIVNVPAPRAFESLQRDGQGDRLVLFGGLFDDGTYSNETWIKGLGNDQRWQELIPAGSVPGRRAGSASVFDTPRRRLVIFGGDGNGVIDTDTWALSLDGSPIWTQLQPLGPNPGPVASSTSIYDPIGQRMLVFGGADAGGTIRNTTWSLSLSGTPSWSLLDPSGPLPPPRNFASAVYDSRRARMVIFGGSNLSDAWALDLAGPPRWAQLATVGSPGARSSALAVYDSLADRMVIFEGIGAVIPDPSVWALSFATDPPSWTRLQPSGPSPFARVNSATIYDPLRSRAVMTCGQSPGVGPDPGPGFTSDTWALSLPPDEVTATEISLVRTDATPHDVRLTWSTSIEVGTPLKVERRTANSGWEPVGSILPDGTGQLEFEDRSVQEGARYGYRLVLEARPSLETQSEVWIDVPTSSVLSVRPSGENPIHGTLGLAFSLVNDSPATLELFDVTGARRLVRDVGALGGGSHTIFLSESHLAAGLYLVRLSQSGQSRVARLVVAP